MQDASQEIGRAWREDVALREILEGTSSEVGEGFFNSLVEHLSSALNVRFAFVAEFAGAGRVRTLAFWTGERHVGPFEYDLDGTPCEEVVSGRLCHHPDNLTERFPRDASLAEWGMRSYLGVPLVDARGDVLGHLAVAHSEPLPDEPRGMAIFRIFAARAAAELRRLRAEHEVREARARLSSVLSNAMDAIVIVDAGLRLQMINRSAERTLGRDEKQLVGASLEPFLAPVLREVLRAVTERAGGSDNSPVWLPEGCYLTRQDGTQVAVEGTISPVVSDGDERFVVILRDTADRERARRLDLENQYLKETLCSEQSTEILGGSSAIRSVLAEIDRVAATQTTVLIQGETGTGKELAARAVHSRSTRGSGPLIKVDCATLPDHMAESELFGHEKGAFEGALEKRIGRFELADGGTLFLDEVGELSPEVQNRLLRVLEEQEFQRRGSSATIRVDVRIVASTNRDLEEEVERGTFRKDLYYRLAGFPLRLPPLRERSDDVVLLAETFCERYARGLGRSAPRLDETSRNWLRTYAWPGNVRELENIIERAVILSTGEELSLNGAAEDAAHKRSNDETLAGMQRDHIERILDRTGGRVEGVGGAASILDIHPNTLRSRMKKLGVVRQRS